VAFVRRKGNTYFLVHNVRRQGKIRQLHLARLGERPRITDDVVRKVSRNHPFLELDWSRLREEVNGRIELFDTRSPYVQNLMHSLRSLNLDLADLSPPMLLLSDRSNSKPRTGHAAEIVALHARCEAGSIRAFEAAHSGRRTRVPVGEKPWAPEPYN